jgi:hypothetical protein
MALINDLISILETEVVDGSNRVGGGEDLLDIRSGPNTLTQATIEVLQAKLDYEREQLNLLSTALAALKALVAHGYPDRKVFEVPPEITDELATKQAAMKGFADELRQVNVGADNGVISLVTTEINPKATKRSKQ